MSEQQSHHEDDIEEGAYELEEQSISESDGEFAYEELPLDTDEEEEDQMSDQFETQIVTQQEPSIQSK